MLDKLNININNFGLIGNANLNIGKINIVGGLNSTGKSTCSKLLYSFLRSNSKTRNQIALKSLVYDVYELAFELLSFTRTKDYEDDTRALIKDVLDEMNDKMKKQVKAENFDVIEHYETLKEIYSKSKIKEDYKKILDNSFNDVQKLVDILEDDEDELFKTVMNQLIKREFGKDTSDLNDVSISGKFNDNEFNYNINIKNSEFDIDGWFIIEDVFYFDSLSVFDLISKGGLQNTEHISHIVSSLEDDESSDWGDEILNDNIINIENKIMSITDGRFEKDDTNIVFLSSEKEFLMKNTSSGIKQLGIIQMLLNTRKLTENSFLIIDEPEVNIHPEWQVKFAEIIVLLAKELDILIYINSHSPLFIEAMRTFSAKYDLLDETNFYLSGESKEKGKFDIINIPSDDLYIIYNALGKPYEVLSEISIETEFGL